MPGNVHTITAQDVSAWPAPNYTDPVQRTWLTGYAIFWQTLSTLFVGGRLYLRVRNQSGPFGIDDVFLIVGWAFTVAFTTVNCLMVLDGDLGRHVWDVRPDRYERLLFYAWLEQGLFVNSTGAIKVSILLFYRRMAKNTYNRFWLYAVWALLFITVSIWISFFIMFCKICTPLHAYWDILSLDQTAYSCLDSTSIIVATEVLTVASDFWTAAFPCAMYNRLKLCVSRRQKITLNCIFCLGFLVTGISIGRTYFLWKLGWDVDASWTGYNLAATATTEIQLGIICTCAPFLRVLFRRYFPDRHAPTPQIRTISTPTCQTSRTSSWSDRGNVYRPTEPLPLEEDEHIMLETRSERKGFLVHSQTSGRLEYSA